MILMPLDSLEIPQERFRRMSGGKDFTCWVAHTWLMVSRVSLPSCLARLFASS